MLYWFSFLIRGELWTIKKITQDGWTYYIKNDLYRMLLAHDNKEHLTLFRYSDFVIISGKVVKCRPLAEDLIEYYLCTDNYPIKMGEQEKPFYIKLLSKIKEKYQEHRTRRLFK